MTIDSLPNSDDNVDDVVDNQNVYIQTKSSQTEFSVPRQSKHFRRAFHHERLLVDCI